MYVDTVIQELFTALQAPLIVLDAEMNLVAHSIHDNVEHDATQVRMIVSRRGTSGAIASFERYSVKYSTEPVRLPGPDGGRGHIVVTLRSAGQPTGYLTFPDIYSNEIPAGHLTAVESAAARLGEALRNRMLDRRRGKEHVRQLVEDLLSPDDFRHDYAVQEILGAHLVPPAESYVVTLVAPEKPGGALHTEALEHLESTAGPTTNQGHPRFVVTVIHGKAVLLVPGKAATADSISSWLAAPALSGCRIAVGGAVEGLADIRRSLRQARIVMEGIRRDPDRKGPAAYWSDLGVDRLLFQLPFDSMEPGDLPDGVRRLLEQENPRLRETVLAYLDAGGNAVETSRRLHVHRSTLYYRLDQASEVTGVDLNDGQIRREFHLALRVAALLGLGR